MDATDLETLARRHGIRLLLQFGSSVAGPTHPRSDVDLAVLLERPAPSLRELAALEADLGRLYPGRPVDVALLSRADPLLLKKILARCRLLYGEPAEFRRVALYAFKRYQDHRRFLALERQFVARAIRELTAAG